MLLLLSPIAVDDAGGAVFSILPLLTTTTNPILDTILSMSIAEIAKEIAVFLNILTVVGSKPA